MLQNAYRRLVDIEYRLQMLELIKHCLERYKETPEAYLLYYAKQFGQVSERLKKDIEKY